MPIDLLRGFRARRPERWLCAAALVASAHAGATDDFSTLTYLPVGLAWSATEVERIASRQARTIVERAARDGQLGCRDHCGRLQAVFERLLPVARAQGPQAARLAWSLTVVRSPTLEALALPGGQVFVSEAFLRQSNLGDEELAFVIAHEMAHCVLEHERQALTFARMLLPRDVPRSVADVYTEMDHNFALLRSMEVVLQQGESEADELGLLMAAAAGYAPPRQIGFIAREAAQAATRPRLLGTHPDAARRLEQLRQRLPLAERIFAAASAH
jgi:predicted Zn-dependent protease